MGSKGNRSTRRNPTPSAALSTTNPTSPDLASNPGCRGGKPATNRLSYGVASCSVKFPVILLGLHKQIPAWFLKIEHGRLLQDRWTKRRVESGYNTSTVIPASRKSRRKGNPVVSDETVMYGYESSVTLTTDRLHYKLQTRSLVRGAPQDEERSNFPTKERKKKNLVVGPKGVSDTKMDRSTDHRS
jgi:hypothetical protein